MDLDGELFGGRKKFQSTVSIVKSGVEKWKDLSFEVGVNFKVFLKLFLSRFF